MERGKGLSREGAVEAYLALLDEGVPANFRGLAAKLGCAHTNLYNFFADWDALRWAAIAEILRRLVAAMEGGAAEGGEGAGRKAVRRAEAEVQAALRAYVDFGLGHPSWYRLVWLEPLASPMPADVRSLSDEAQAAVFARLARALPGSGGEGLKTAVACGHDLVHGALAKLLSGREPAPPDAAAFSARLADLALAAMAAAARA
ncbi:MAG TPA: TetR-like C-terminal domain-containing protein [Spirochaetia bacterium]|nr:TetR-like C-terminal domain-containing protein [Spirochaetales bacterium]HRY72440.1 TetR-like C-terminal domain-containing protein [Spirochaetia bacterium]